MAVVVRQRSTNSLFVLLGGGRRKGDTNLLAFSRADVLVCDEGGRIGWIPGKDLYVVEIDGQAPASLIDGVVQKFTAVDDSPMPAFGAEEVISDEEVADVLNDPNKPPRRS